jgi:hypothetical protein
MGACSVSGATRAFPCLRGARLGCRCSDEDMSEGEDERARVGNSYCEHD